MKLYARPVSPYVRKVRVAAMETGTDRLFETYMIPTQAQQIAEVPSVNPIGKVPTMVLDDGSSLFDSPVICAYLDGLHDGPKLFPDGPARWQALGLLAIGDGITDAGIELNLERRLRPEDARWEQAIERQAVKIRNGFDLLETRSAELDAEPPTIGPIAVACAIGYIAFRHPHLGITSDRHPKLTAWYAKFAERPSMKATEPYDP